MNSKLLYDDEPGAKGYGEWLFSPNVAAIGRLVYAVSWISRCFLLLRGAWVIIRANWSPMLLILLIVGPGEFGLFVMAAIMFFYALMPYYVYVYCVEKRIGAFGNAGLNFAAWWVVEVLLDYAGSLAVGYFLD